ncbi:MAG: hypothetical protein ACLVCH_08370 [Roseburia inulinivorans]
MPECKHMMDAQGGLEYLIEGIITNASQYISGEVTDFSAGRCKSG